MYFQGTRQPRVVNHFKLTHTCETRMYQRTQYYKDQQCHSLQLYLTLIRHTPFKGKGVLLNWRLQSAVAAPPSRMDVLPCTPLPTSPGCPFRSSLHLRGACQHKAIPWLSLTPQTSRYWNFLDSFLVQSGLKTTVKRRCTFTITAVNTLFIWC